MKSKHLNPRFRPFPREKVKRKVNEENITKQRRIRRYTAVRSEAGIKKPHPTFPRQNPPLGISYTPTPAKRNEKKRRAEQSRAEQSN
jgi:hypothetical protein